MDIRCERCSTVYTLDEKLLPPGGAPVECTHCHNVFTAYPPQAAGRTAVFAAPRPPTGPPPPLGPPPPPLIPPRAAAPAPPFGRTEVFSPPSPPVPRQPSAPVSPPAPRPGRASRAPAEKPAPSPATRPGQPTGPKRPDTIATFGAQVRRRRRWTLLGPLLAVLVGAGGYAGWRWQSRRISPAALEKRQQGLALLVRDDSESLRRAAAAFSEAVAIDGKLFQAEADRTLTALLLAADTWGEAMVLEARFRALDAIRLEQEKASGSPEQGEGVLQQMRLVKADLEPLQDRARKLEEEAVATLRRLAGERADDLAVARAVAVHLALAGDAEKCATVLQKARAAGSQDPWLDLAEAAVWAAPALPAEMRSQAQSKLAQVAASRPELLRARLLLARTQAELERKEAAVATLDGLLAANPEHDQARRLKAELLAPPPARPLASPAVTQTPRAPPPPEGRETLPRKAASSPR